MAFVLLACVRPEARLSMWEGTTQQRLVGLPYCAHKVCHIVGTSGPKVAVQCGTPVKGCVLCGTVQGRVDVNQETGELKLLVKINAKSQGAEAKKSKAVKDLKQLSGMQTMHYR